MSRTTWILTLLRPDRRPESYPFTRKVDAERKAARLLSAHPDAEFELSCEIVFNGAPTTLTSDAPVPGRPGHLAQRGIA